MSREAVHRHGNDQVLRDGRVDGVLVVKRYRFCFRMRSIRNLLGWTRDGLGSRRVYIQFRVFGDDAVAYGMDDVRGDMTRSIEMYWRRNFHIAATLSQAAWPF